MEPGAGAKIKRSHIIKIFLLTLIFTLGYFYNAHRQAVNARLRLLVKKDSSNIITAAPPASPENQPQTPAESNQTKKKKTIYLTFDDGPNKGTKNLLDIINEEQVPATLFVIGEHVYGSLLQSAVYDSVRNSAFIELANHSYTHAAHNKFSKFYALPQNVVNDFRRCADSLRLSSNIIRTPGRNTWRVNNIRHGDNPATIAAADTLEKKGYTLMGWDLEWHFNNKLQPIQSFEELARQVDSMFQHNYTRTPNHLVLLAHDQVYGNSKDSSSLRKFVSLLKAKGEYDFAFINSYPGIEKKALQDSGLKKK